MTKEERIALAEKKLEEMKAFERELYDRGCVYIAGTDEVGRGPLAGPVVAAAVILPQDFRILGVDDSKKLSEKKREQLFDAINREALTWGIGIVDSETIDRINILQASKLAMRMAIEQLDPRPDHLLVDAMTLETVSLPQTGIIRGDGRSVTIAAASILAKVTRDRMMLDYHRLYDCYAFDSNKGYGTQAHYDGLRKYGLCPIHRRSFLKNERDLLK